MNSRGVLLLASLAFTACGTSVSHLERAEHLRGTGEFRTALIEVRNVLQKDVENSRARFDFADLLYRTGDLNAAEIEVKRVKGRETDVALLTARIALAGGKNAAALKILEQIPPSQGGTVELNLAKSDALVGLGRYDEARALLKLPAVQADVRSQVGIARVMQLQGDESGAKSLLVASTAQHPAFGPAWSMLGALCLHRGELAEAEEAYSHATSADSRVDTTADRVAALSGLIETRLARNNPVGAREALARLQLAAPQSLVTGYSQAQVDAAAGNYTEATAQLEALVQRDWSNAAAWMLLGRLQSSQGYLERAEKSLRRAVDVAPDNLAARQQLAQVQLRLARPEAAVESLSAILDAQTLSPASSAGGNDGAVWSAAQISAHGAVLSGKLLAGAEAEALAELRAWPGEAYSRGAPQVAALVAAASPSARTTASHTLRDITAGSAQNSDLQLLVATVFSQCGNTEEALLGARRALRARPGDVRTALLAGDVMLSVGAAQEALGVFRGIAASGPEAADVLLATAHAQLALGNTAEARTALDGALARRPQSMQANVLQVLIDLRQGQNATALQRVGTMQSRYPDSAVPQVLMGDVLAARNDFAGAAGAYARAAARSGLWQPVIREYQMRRAARQSDADASLRHWLVGHPNDYAVRASLATYLAGVGHRDEAIAEFERMQRQHPDDAATLNDLAWLYGARGDGRAIPLARQALKLQPRNPSILDTLGWLLIQQGSDGEGLPLVTQASQLAPNDLNIQFHRAYALVRTGETERAEVTLRSLLATRVEFPERAAAQRLLESTQNPKQQ